MTTITTAQDWADALDAHQKQHRMSAGTLTSEAYADGAILGVTLDPYHPAADDERPVLVSADGWAVRWVPERDWWEPAATAALDANAQAYEEAQQAYAADSGAPGVSEAVEAAWDTMVDAVEAARHDVDTCPCRSCTLYRAGTEER